MKKFLIKKIYIIFIIFSFTLISGYLNIYFSTSVLSYKNGTDLNYFAYMVQIIHLYGWKSILLPFNQMFYTCSYIFTLFIVYLTSFIVNQNQYYVLLFDSNFFPGVFFSFIFLWLLYNIKPISNYKTFIIGMYSFGIMAIATLIGSYSGTKFFFSPFLPGSFSISFAQYFMVSHLGSVMYAIPVIIFLLNYQEKLKYYIWLVFLIPLAFFSIYSDRYTAIIFFGTTIFFEGKYWLNYYKYKNKLTIYHIRIYFFITVISVISVYYFQPTSFIVDTDGFRFNFSYDNTSVQLILRFLIVLILYLCLFIPFLKRKLPRLFLNFVHIIFISTVVNFVYLFNFSSKCSTDRLNVVG